MMPKRQLSRFLAVATIGLVGCGGAPPPSAPPAASQAPPGESAKTASPSPAVSTPVTATGTPAIEAPAAASSAPAPDAPAPKSARSLGDVLTAPSVAFMLNYGGSAAKHAAETLCTGRAGEDLQKRAECMEKERERLTADVLVFGKSGKVLSLTVYRRARNTLLETSKAQVEFAKETESSLLVKVKSEKGTRPIFVGKKEFVVSAPTDSSLELDDPQFGKLVYEAKIGIVDKPSD